MIALILFLIIQPCEAQSARMLTATQAAKVAIEKGADNDEAIRRHEARLNIIETETQSLRQAEIELRGVCSDLSIQCGQHRCGCDAGDQTAESESEKTEVAWSTLGVSFISGAAMAAVVFVLLLARYK